LPDLMDSKLFKRFSLLRSSVLTRVSLAPILIP